MLFKDQYNNEIQLHSFPKRIISLVPSQTELLYHLGLDERVVGITKFCIYPEEWFKTKVRIGGPKTVDLEKVKALKPDLIIANKEENIKEQIEVLQEIAPVWISDVFDLKDALEMIAGIGEICDKKKEAQQINQEIKENFATLNKSKKTSKVVYMIWKEPFMAVGKDTFIDAMLTDHLGVDNVIKEARYPILNKESLPDVDYVFLSTEPYPFSEKHIPEIQTFFPNAKILVVDGEYFTWYGSRLRDTPSYFKNVLERM